MSGRRPNRSEARAVSSPRTIAPRSPDSRPEEHREHRLADRVPRDTNAAAAKQERIQELWAELARTKPKTLQYDILLKNIRDLSADYDALLQAPRKPQQPNN
jgi:hypothetical protein